MKKQISFLVGFFIIIINLSISTAIELNSFTAYNQIFDNNVKSTYRYEFSNSSDMIMEISLPKDTSSISLVIDDERIDTDSIKKPNSVDISIPITNNTKEVKLIFLRDSTLNLFSESTYISDLEIPYDTKEVNILTALPQGASLSENSQEVNVAFPEPTAIVTDGKRIIIKWKFLEVKQNSVISSFIMFNYSVMPDLWFVFFIIIIIGIIILNFIYGFKKRKEKYGVDSETYETEFDMDKHLKEFEIERHLKEDEKTVINILKNKDGETTQATLRVITGMSKSTLSRVIMELEQRNLVHKEKRGNKNVVTLKE